eukprot:TRINITY_DN547_c0_g1_i1.p1 TRINITY_DN547_c0_g1~~TRINITY_DN547_c0_g1_i1.p1  ORF type:complete len:2178 (+),score=469.78 TRINITY_DN547_c0_g1_i1:249-6782(+)
MEAPAAETGSQVVTTEVTTDIPEEMQGGKHRISSHNLNRRTRVGEEFYKVNTGEESGEAGWIRQQRKAFVRWCNAFLIQRDIQITRFEDDLTDGLVLVNLLECLGGKKLPNPTKNPRMKIQKCINIQISLDWITKVEGLRLTNISPQDIYEGKTKLILGLIWTLILHYHLAAGRWNREDLLGWVNQVLATQGKKVSDFTDSWKDGTAFAGLVDYLLNRYDLGPLDITEETSPFDKLELAFETALKEFKIPKLLDAEDMDEPDAQSIMSYVSYFRKKDKPDPIAVKPVEAIKSRDAAAPAAAQEPAKPKVKVTAEGDGLKHAEAGEQSHFKVHTVDADKEDHSPIHDDEAVITSTIELDGNSAPVAVDGNKKDGSFDCAYTVNAAGHYNLNVYNNGKPAAESPYKVTVSAGSASGVNSSAHGSGLSQATCGEDATFVVQTRDKHDNPLKSGGRDVKASLSPTSVPSHTASPAPGRKGAEAQTSKPVEVQIKDKDDGTYDASYKPLKPGKYSLNVTVDGNNVKDSPFLVKVASKGVSASHTVASGHGLTAAVAGEPTDVTVTTQDDLGNVIHDLEVAIEAKLKPHGEKEGESTPVSVHDNNDGTYKLGYVPAKAGPLDLSITCNGKDIAHSPFKVDVAAGAVKPSKSEAEGPGLEKATSGEPAQFVVRLKDEQGNVLRDTKDAVVEATLHVKGGESGESGDVKATITPSDDGTFKGEYVPKKAGQFPLSVTVNGHDVKGSKFNVTVGAGKVRPEGITAFGDGLASAVAGQPATFYVVPEDEYGNLPHDVDAADLDLAVVVKPKSDDGSPLKPTVGDKQQEVARPHGKGKAQAIPVSYNPEKAGDYEVGVTSAGKDIKGSPFHLNVSPARPSALNSHAEGEGISPKLVTGERPLEFQVTLLDDFGNTAPLSDGQELKAALEGHRGKVPCTLKSPEGAEKEKEKEHKGKAHPYVFSYPAPNAAGKYSVSVTLDGQDIDGSAFPVEFEAGETNPGSTTASGDGLSKATVGKPASFVVSTKDAAGNPTYRAGDDIAAALAVDDEKVKANVDDKKDGSYEVHYTPKKTGKFNLDVQANGKPIHGSPFEVAVKAGDASPLHTRCEGPGLTSAVANEAAVFKVITADEAGNPLEKGGVPVHVDIAGEGTTITPTVVDQNDGTYVVSYTPKVKGDYNIGVSVGPKGDSGAGAGPVKDSPFHVTVAPGEQSSSHTVAEGPGLTKAVAGEKAEFTVIAHDNSGNKVETGGAKVTAALRGVATVDAEVSDKGDGTYPAHYTPTVSGIYSLEVKSDGENVKDSPFSVEVVPGPAFGPKSTAEGPGLSKGIAGEPAKFDVELKDPFGNKVGKDNQGKAPNVEAFLAVPNADGSTDKKPVTLKDNGDGTFSADFVPEVAGPFDLEVLVDGKPVAGSPFKVNVAPSSTLDGKKFTASGDGLSEATVGQSASFTIQSKDKFGNPLSTGGHAKGLKAVLTSVDDGHSQSQLAPTHATGQTAGAEGTTQAAPAAQAPLSASAKKRNRRRKKAAGSVSPRGGQPTSTTSSSAAPAEDLSASSQEVSLNRPIEAAIHDNNDGTYTAQYKAIDSGEYKLAVTFDGADIQDSPFTVKVKPGSAQPSETVAWGDGLSKAVAGQPATFKVETRDAESNKIPAESVDTAPVARLASAEDPSSEKAVPVELHVDPENNDFTASYAPQKAGPHNLHVTIGGKEIKDSPFSVNVGAGPVNTDHLDLEPSTLDATSDEPLKLQAGFKDLFGNPAALENPEDLDVFVGDAAGDPKDKKPVTVEKNKNGGADIQVPALEKPGDHPLHVNLKDKDGNTKPFAGSPFNIKVAPGKAANGILTTKPEPSPVAGSEQKAVLQAVDKHNNPVKSGGDDVQFKLRGPDNTSVPAQVTDNKDGTYNVDYKPTKAGEYHLFPTVSDNNVDGSPFVFHVVPGSADPGTTFALGKGLEEATAGEPATFMVQSLDSFGNEIKTGGANITASLHPEKSDKITPATVTDNNDGLYKVEYTVDESGRHVLDVNLDDQPISKSPYLVDVESGEVDDIHVDPKDIVTKGKPGDNLLKIAPKDKHGNPKKKGGDKDKVKFHLVRNIKRPCEIVDNGDGTYGVKYPPGLEKGEYQVKAKLLGKALDPSKVPEKVEIEEEPEEALFADEAQHQYLNERMPQSAPHVTRFLRTLSPADRAKFVAELKGSN